MVRVRVRVRVRLRVRIRVRVRRLGLVRVRVGADECAAADIGANTNQRMQARLREQPCAVEPPPLPSMYPALDALPTEELMAWGERPW